MSLWQWLWSRSLRETVNFNGEEVHRELEGMYLAMLSVVIVSAVDSLVGASSLVPCPDDLPW